MDVPDNIKGNPKVSHWDCAYEACRASRERLVHLKQARLAAQRSVSGSLDKPTK